MNFKLHSKYEPTGDQPQAIAQLLDGLRAGQKAQTLLGVTGSGKTFTMANIIEKYNRPTLVLAHNKTLAAQLYSEFREFFPENEVHYFVSYFDYYQPEAYIASTDTYIEKDSAINEEIDRLRHGATEALLTRRDTLIVASVSCIYGIGSPDNYKAMAIRLAKGEQRDMSQFIYLLTEIQYHRNDIAFERGNFRVRGDTVDLFPASGDRAYRLEFGFDTLERIKVIDPLTAEVLAEPDKGQHQRPAGGVQVHGVHGAAGGLVDQVQEQPCAKLEQTGFVKGIENYSRHLDGRVQGQPPATLLDYFPDDYLMLIDESHMTLPQVRGMFNGDRARKETLVEYGFRLPSALDNRPLTFTEFESHINQVIFTSATPGEYELQHSPSPAQQVIRPTGLLDPEIEVRPSEGQIDNLVDEIDERIKKQQRVLVTTLTKRMAEDLSEHLVELGIKTAYIHSDIDTLERGDILRDLRAGTYDVLVGINLLREGLDLPEVSLVAILDADKEGFLRSESALVQTIGRAARHVEGKVIMYADSMTGSMERAINETYRRREIQQKYNEEHNITPRSVAKEIGEGLRAIIPEKEKSNKLDLRKIPREELPQIVKELTSQMQLAAANLEFERAAELRDQIEDIKTALERKK